MKNNKIIYALKCPFTDDIHYIGKSTKGMTRPKQHMKNSHSKKVNEWVTELKSLGYRPKIEILQRLNEGENIDSAEVYWIEKYLSEGALLLNSNLVNPVFLSNKINDELKDIEYGDINHISKFIKERRKRLNITQDELASRSGIGLRYIRKVEQGKNNIMLNNLLHLLSMFGATLDVIDIRDIND